MKRLLVLTIIIAGLLLTIAPATAQEGTTFTWGTFGNVVSLDSMNTTDGISFRAITQGCEGLLQFDGATTAVVPALASSWETSEDGLTWVFQLRDDVMFHDGTPFNAEAVVWNFERWGLTDHPDHYEEFIFTYYSYFFGGYDEESLIASVEATGEYEVTFTLRQPNGVFLTNMAPTMTSIHSPTAVKANGTSYGEPEVGYVCTGPYTFAEWLPDQHVILERNPDYWGEVAGNVDRIVFRVIPDNAARFAALQTGEIDGTEQINVEDIPSVEAADDLYLGMRPPLNIMYLAFNYRVKELRDVNVRRAISMAIDRAALVEAFYPPGAVVAKTQVPSSLWGFNDDVPFEAYDPEGALELLAEAGYPDGFSEMSILALDDDGMVTDEVEDVIPFTLWYQPVVRPYNPDGQAIGEAMASFLADIGIEVTLETRDWGDYLQLGRDGELFGVYQLGWSADTPDPDNFSGTFFINTDTPLNRSGWYMNPELDAILKEARQLADKAAREPLYQQADQIMYDDVTRLWIAHTGVPLAFRDCVSGYIPHPMNEPFKVVTVTCE